MPLTILQMIDVSSVTQSTRKQVPEFANISLKIQNASLVGLMEHRKFVKSAKILLMN